MNDSEFNELFENYIRQIRFDLLENKPVSAFKDELRKMAAKALDFIKQLLEGK